MGEASAMRHRSARKDKPWRNEKLKNLEDMPRLGGGELQGKDRSGMRWLSSKRAVGFDERNKRRSGGILRKGGTVWVMAAARLHYNVLLNP